MSGKCASSIRAARCDTASSEEVAAIFGSNSRKQGVPPISGVIHSGGVLADAVLASQSAGDSSAVHCSKVTKHVLGTNCLFCLDIESHAESHKSLSDNDIYSLSALRLQKRDCYASFQ